MSDELEPEQEAAGEEEQAEPANDDRGGRRTTLLIVAVAVAALAAIGVGIYLVATSGEEAVADDPPRPTITGVTPSEPASDPPLSDPPSVPSAPAASTAITGPPAVDKNVAAARSAAEQAATAINERDIDAMRKLSCDPSTVGSVEEFPPQATARLTASPQITGDRATAQIELTISGSDPTVVPLPMEKRGGKWCVP